MPLPPEQEALCERLEKGESTPTAATLIQQQAQESDDLWDRLSRAYALVRQESPKEMIQEEMEALRAMLDERRSSSLARRLREGQQARCINGAEDGWVAQRSRVRPGRGRGELAGRAVLTSQLRELGPAKRLARELPPRKGRKRASKSRGAPYHDNTNQDTS